jgi:hypothetical protein
MAKNYKCTHCPMEYDFPPLRCANCGHNSVIYTGEANREQDRERERRAQQQRRQAEEQRRQAEQNARREDERMARQRQKAKVEKEKPGNKPTPRGSKPTPGAKPKWSWGAAILFFLIGTGVGINQFGMARDPALVFGGMVGLICGRYYARVIVVGIIAFIAYTYLQKH